MRICLVGRERNHGVIGVKEMPSTISYLYLPLASDCDSDFSSRGHHTASDRKPGAREWGLMTPIILHSDPLPAAI